MAVTALPDLNVLPAEELRALILAQHEQLVSAEDKLTTTQEQLLSREREIEHLKLLLVKLHRMQFGRKSEKLAAADRAVGVAAGGAGIQPQRERVHAARTGFGPSWFDCQCSEARASRSARSSPAANAPARAQRNRVPAMPGRVAQVGRGCLGDAGVRARQFRGDPARAHEAELHEVRLHRAGGSAKSPDRARPGGAGTVGACAGLEVLRSSAAVSAVGDLRASRCGTGALDDGRLGRRMQSIAGTAGGSAASLRDGRRQTARRRHAGAGVGAGPGQDQDGAVVDVCSR